MKNFITNAEKKKAINALTTEELKAIKGIIEELKNFTKTPTITEKGYRALNNSFRQLEIFKESYTTRFIMLLKQGNLLT